MLLLSPYSNKLEKGENPKNYPWWEDVVRLLKDRYSIIQIGIKGELPIKDVDMVMLGLSFEEIELILRDCDVWISVDNFLPHMANYINKTGVVIWGQSDPKLFGYSKNKNLLKSEDNLRHNQFGLWTEAEYKEDVFVSPHSVVKAIMEV